MLTPGVAKVAAVEATARPPRRKTQSRESLENLSAVIAHELAAGSSLRAVHLRLVSAGLAVSYATLRRFAVTSLAHTARPRTPRVAEPTLR